MKKSFGRILFLISVLILFYACSSNNNASESKESKNLLLEKADVYYKNKDYPNSIICFDEIIKNDTTIGEIYFRRAFAKSQTDNPLGSIQDNLKAANLNYKLDKTNFNIGVDYMMLCHESLALLYFTKAYKINPNDDDAEYEMNSFKEIVRSDSLKLHSLTKAYEINPGDKNVKKEIDLLYTRLHNPMCPSDIVK